MANRRKAKDPRPGRRRAEAAAGAGGPPSSPSHSAPSRVADGVVYAVLVVVVLATFGRLFAADFTTWDDPGTLTENRWFNPPDAAGLVGAWTRPNMDLWVPVTYSVWWGTAQLAWGTDAATGQGALSPAPFHGLNVLLHAGAACLTFALLRRLRFRTPAAALGAAVFALHPVQVESVGWTSGMKDVLFGLLALASVYAYVIAVDDRKAAEDQAAGEPVGRPFPRVVPYAAAVLLLAAALMSKPTAVVVPAIAFVVDWRLVGRPLRRAALTAAPLLAVTVPFAVVAKLVQDVPHDDSAVPLAFRPLVAADAVAFYFSKLLAPVDLCVDYSRDPSRARAQGWVFWTWVFPAAAAVVAAWAWARRRAAVPATAFALFLLGMAPVLGFVRFDFQNLSTVGDHYLYLPMFGVAVLVAWAASTRRPWPRWSAAAVGVVLVALAARSFDQTAHWQDTKALFDHTLAVNPDSSVALNSLTAMAVREGRTEEAIRLGERALAVRPFDVPTQVSVGSAYASAGRLAEATALYRKAYERMPDDPLVLSNLSGILAGQRRFDEALPMAERAVALHPYVARAQLNYGAMLVDVGRLDEGTKHLAEAIRIEPKNVPARIKLALALMQLRRPGEAAEQFDAVLRIDPNNGFAQHWAGQLRGGGGAAR